MSSSQATPDTSVLSPHSSSSSSGTNETSYERISQEKGVKTSYLTPATNEDSRKWSSTTSVGNLSTAAQIDEDEDRSEVYTPTLGSRPSTPSGAGQWSDDEGGQKENSRQDSRQVPAGYGEGSLDSERHPIGAEGPQVITQARTHPFGGKGAHWKGVPLHESYQKRLDENIDEEPTADETPDITTVSRSSTNVASSVATQGHGPHSKTAPDGALSRSSTNIASNAATHGHDMLESEYGTSGGGISRSSTAATNAFSTTGTYGHGHPRNSQLTEDSGVSRSTTVASNVISITANHGHNPASGTVSRSSTMNWSHRASPGHSGDNAPRSAAPSSHGASLSPQSSSLEFSTMASDGHPKTDFRQTMSPLTEDTGSLRLSEPSTNRRSIAANDGHVSSTNTFYDGLSDENGYTHSASSDTATNTSADDGRPEMRQSPLSSRPTPTKDLSTTADPGHSELSLDGIDDDESQPPSLSLTSSEDSSKTNKGSIMHKFKGEAKILKGKLSHDEEKIEEGKRLLGKSSP